jgi:hypothetical protein
VTNEWRNSPIPKSLDGRRPVHLILALEKENINKRKKKE